METTPKIAPKTRRLGLSGGISRHKLTPFSTPKAKTINNSEVSYTS